MKNIIKEIEEQNRKRNREENKEVIKIYVSLKYVNLGRRVLKNNFLSTMSNNFIKLVTVSILKMYYYVINYWNSLILMLHVQYSL